MTILSYIVVEKSLTKKNTIPRMEKKLDKYRDEQAGEGWFSITRYSKSSSACIPNMTILVFTVVEKSLMKSFTKKGTDGRTDRCKPVYPNFFKADV